MKEFKHREFFPSHQISFWRANHASDRENAERVTVHVGMYSLELPFSTLADKSQLSRICTLLESAFACGRYDKQNEILKVLGVK